MIGIMNRPPQVVCEVGVCTWTATHAEYVTVIPDDLRLKKERHSIDIVLCHRHDEQFHRDGLVGIITAYGDEISERAC